MSNASKILKKLSSALNTVDTDEDQDIKLTVKELVKWVGKHNEVMLKAGLSLNYIQLYKLDGSLDPRMLQEAFERYNTYYIRNRQPIVQARNSKTGISLIDDSYKFLTVETKTKKKDLTIPRVGRPDKDWGNLDGPSIGNKQLIGPDEVRTDF